ARQPSAIDAGLADIDRLVAAAQPVLAALADDQPGDGLAGAVLQGDLGRVAGARVVEIEPREQFRPFGLRLDEGQVGEAEQQLVQLAGRRWIVALVDNDPASADRGEINLGRAARRADPGEFAELGVEPGQGTLIGRRAARGAVARDKREYRERHEDDRGDEERNKRPWLHWSL